MTPIYKMAKNRNVAMSPIKMPGKRLVGWTRAIKEAETNLG